MNLPRYYMLTRQSTFLRRNRRTAQTVAGPTGKPSDAFIRKNAPAPRGVRRKWRITASKILTVSTVTLCDFLLVLRHFRQHRAQHIIAG